MKSIWILIFILFMSPVGYGKNKNSTEDNLKASQAKLEKEVELLSLEVHKHKSFGSGVSKSDELSDELIKKVNRYMLALGKLSRLRLLEMESEGEI